MKILCLNVGSTSVKCTAFDFPSEKVLFQKKYETKSFGKVNPYEKIFSDLLKKVSQYQFEIIAHRFVHGMWPVKHPYLLNSKNIKKVEKWNSLLPLHLPFNIKGYLSSRKVFSKSRHYALFDHACYQGLDDLNSIFSLPENYVKKYQLRKFGYHGLSHEYSAFEISRELKIPLKKLKLISCHLGGGSSISAYDRGYFIDTTMEMSALSGLPMTTRSGTIDPGVIFRILRDGKTSLEKLENDFYKNSGLKGIQGQSGDMRILLENYSFDRQSKLAVDYYVNQIVKAISGFYVQLDGAHVISFTGGIGENASKLRKMIIDKLKILNIKIDSSKNRKKLNSFLDLTHCQSQTQVVAVACEEELHMARLVNQLS